jgi:hypothetical protein
MELDEELAIIDMFGNAIYYHYRNPLLCRAPEALPSVFFRALGKEGFAESQIKNTRQSLCTRQRSLCRASDKRLSAKKFLCREPKKHSAKKLLCREPKKKHSAKASLPSAKVKHSAKQFFKPHFGALNEFK